jgi:hypothetical protein
LAPVLGDGGASHEQHGNEGEDHAIREEAICRE